MADLKEQHASNKFCSNCRKNATETSEMVKLVDNGKNTSIKQFPKFQNYITSVKMLNAWYLHQQAKHMKIWWNLSFKTEETKSVKFLTYRKFHLGQFRAFWKNIWTSVRLQPNTTCTCRTVNFWLNQNPPYSPHLVPYDFYLFWKLMMVLNERWLLPPFNKTDGGPCWVSNSVLQEMLWMVQ